MFFLKSIGTPNNYCKYNQSKIGYTFNLVNHNLKDLYCVIPSLPVSLEYKNEVTGMQNSFFNVQHGKSQRTVHLEDTDGNWPSKVGLFV